ncbi:MAG: hypothetical protein US60_C0014G0011 [Microgenomates group bacterium GW2011_GWC1_37_8]|uniref:Uncharacterized protein n=2 Tax=Candidatus Woeseibacteriota TaxID=1752722 RepID=A0A0G0NES0_9BACT|nr:MAG: hypothetical protein US60_C0014G0011 [Microgenomates group bacterium GW2011_GWC1_37_8]KKQ84404.1 MAG: hypothetical protein UT08_C0018G0010 [Candidatus Woesebacteria bacterium GW2011_GWB1_38_8]OGM21984.1 MAG: hypothetical protein A2863_03290 [Candidatus Woesebacteria bacterium RIFCSPHIGHO2_01_FULL_38_9b]
MKALIVIIIAILLSVIFYLSVIGIKECGGFVGLSCPKGFSCRVTDSYPDALGRCVFNPFVK